MHKLIVFDLDDTLAPIGRKMSDEDVNNSARAAEQLRRMRERIVDALEELKRI